MSAINPSESQRSELFRFAVLAQGAGIQLTREDAKTRYGRRLVRSMENLLLFGKDATRVEVAFVLRNGLMVTVICRRIGVEL